jgi:hypothetical protein
MAFRATRVFFAGYRVADGATCRTAKMWRHVFNVPTSTARFQRAVTFQRQKQALTAKRRNRYSRYR